MTKYIRKNQKKVLAIFSVGLMVAFALPSMTSNTRRTEGNVGSIDGGKSALGSREYNGYRNQWVGLKRQFGPQPIAAVLGGIDRVDESLVVKVLGDPQSSDRIDEYGQMVQQNPMFARFLNQETGMLYESARAGAPVFRQIESIDELFPLLVKEAQMMGVGVNGDLIESILAARGLSRDADPELYDSMQHALRSLLMVNNAAARAAAVVKVTQPEVRNLLATQRQQIAVNLVEFAAKDFLDKVPAPTPQQVQEQFDKYKNKEAGEGRMDFGYKYPNRVKYDAVQINRDEVKKGVAPVELEQIWEYYLRNKDSFVKETGPSTRPEDTFSLQPGPTTRPMTFDEAKEKIVTRLTNDRVEELATKVRDEIRTTMKADYDAYKAAVADATKGSASTGAPTTNSATSKPTVAVPPSSLGVPYNSFDYLKKLRDKVQADLKVAVSIEQQDAWQTPKSLEESKLGKDAFATDARLPLPFYLSRLLDPFLSEEEKKQVASARGDNRPAAVWEPTPVFRDAKDNLLIARATAADPTHVPPSVDEVKEKVAGDVKTAAAFEKAKQAAQATLDAAKTKWLASVANEEGKQVLGTPLFTLADGSRSATPAAIADLKGPALDSFVQGAFKLLALPPRSGEAPRPVTTQPATKPAATQVATTQPTTKAASKTTAKGPTTKPTTKAVAAAATTRPTPTTGPMVTAAFKDHPVGLIEVPAEGKVMVVEVDQVKPIWTKDHQAMWDTGVAFQERNSFEQALRSAWFMYDNVVKRLNYVPEEKPNRKQPQQPLPPVSPF
jgi:hypothetical protein